MKNVSNISSEEELLELRNEGKISEAEYQDLLETMKKASRSRGEKLVPEIDKTKSKRKLGIIAFVLMLMGIILPIAWFLFIELLVESEPDTHAAIGPSFFLGLAHELAALVMGVIAWSDDFGKGTMAGSVAIMVIALLFVL